MCIVTRAAIKGGCVIGKHTRGHFNFARAAFVEGYFGKGRFDW